MHLSSVSSILVSACQYFFCSQLQCPFTYIPIYLLSICNSVSSSTAAFIYSIDVHMGMSTPVLMVYLLTFIPDTSWSWFPTCCWHDSQSAIYNSASTLYKMCTLYWCINSMKHYKYFGMYHW